VPQALRGAVSGVAVLPDAAAARAARPPGCPAPYHGWGSLKVAAFSDAALAAGRR
jgi:hypothetical protein